MNKRIAMDYLLSRKLDEIGRDLGKMVGHALNFIENRDSISFSLIPSKITRDPKLKQSFNVNIEVLSEREVRVQFLTYVLSKMIDRKEFLMTLDRLTARELYRLFVPFVKHNEIKEVSINKVSKELIKIAKSLVADDEDILKRDIEILKKEVIKTIDRAGWIIEEEKEQWLEQWIFLKPKYYTDFYGKVRISGISSEPKMSVITELYTNKSKYINRYFIGWIERKNIVGGWNKVSSKLLYAVSNLPTHEKLLDIWLDRLSKSLKEITSEDFYFDYKILIRKTPIVVEAESFIYSNKQIKVLFTLELIDKDVYIKGKNLSLKVSILDDPIQVARKIAEKL